MSISRRKLYTIFALALASGYAWLTFEFISRSENDGGGLCIFRHLTSLPCPSCGSTRSVISLIRGNIPEALSSNPLGIIIAAVMLIGPLWLAYDLAAKKSSLHNAYAQAELWLKKPGVAIPLICLVVANWIWNICKGL